MYFWIAVITVNRTPRKINAIVPKMGGGIAKQK